jgi:hypothetical protein
MSKLQWFQDQREINRNNLKNVRCEASQQNKFNTGYQPRCKVLREKNGDLFAYTHNILNRRKKYFNQLLKVHSVRYVRQTEIHTAERLVPGPSSFEVEITIVKLKKYKSPDNDQILEEMIQAGGKSLLFKIQKLRHSLWNKEELLCQWKEAIIVPIHKKGDKTNSSDYRGISLL